MTLGVITSIILIIIGLTIVFQKTGSESKQANYEINYKGNRITYSELIPENGKAAGKDRIAKLFGNDPENEFLLDSTANDSIHVSFEQPVYISKLILHENVNSSRAITERPEYIHLRMGGNESDFISDWIDYPMQNNNTSHVISFRDPQGFCSIFRAKVLTIDIQPENIESSRHVKLALNRIEIIFDNQPFLKPTITLDEIKQRYVRGRKEWNINTAVKFRTLRQIDIEEQLSYELMLNLSYYALLGNREAETLLMSYSPSGAHDGEYASGIRSWYELTEKYNSPAGSD
jgi:hypothetical protein